MVASFQTFAPIASPRATKRKGLERRSTRFQTPRRRIEMEVLPFGPFRVAGAILEEIGLPCQAMREDFQKKWKTKVTPGRK
ncbi:MAG TPA: hypothetical protein DD670_14020 [Planctomycetaceae bacterium]|nr:hypothetical protein [Planctomycetaceae bacterium]